MAVVQAVPTVHQVVYNFAVAALTGHHHRNNTVYVATLMLFWHTASTHQLLAISIVGAAAADLLCGTPRRHMLQ